MNNNLKITCPKCKGAFDAGDAFNAHFENAQIENEKKLKDATKKRNKKLKINLSYNQKNNKKKQRK